MGQRFLQQSSDNDGEYGNTNYHDVNKQNLVNHNNEDSNNKTDTTVKAHITDDNSHAMTNTNSSTQQEQLILNFTPDMRHSSLLAIGTQYDFLNTIHEQNARHLASISSQEVNEGKNGKEDSIINNKSYTEKENTVPSAYLPDHPYQHQTNSNNTNEQMQQCKEEPWIEHNTETRQSPVNYASLFSNGDHLLHNNKLDGEPKNVFYYYNNRTPTIATAESRKTNYTKANTNKENVITTNNWESCQQSATSKFENNRTIEPQEKFVEETEQLQNTNAECSANRRVSENDKTMHVLPPITKHTREQMNDRSNSKHQINSLRTWENVKPKWYKSNIVKWIKKSLSHAESNNVHSANNVKRSNDSKNNNFAVHSHHLPQSNGVMMHKNDNIYINTISREKSKNEKLEQFSKKDNNTNEYDYSLQTAQKENSMLEYVAQVEMEQEREEKRKRLKRIDRIMRGELPDDHNENNTAKNATFVKEQKNSCNNSVGSNPKTRYIASQSHENALHSNSHVNDKAQINKTAEEEQLQALMSALFGKATHNMDKPISLCNNNIDISKEHKQTSESKQLVSQEQQQEHEEQSQSSEEKSSNKYLSVDDEVICFCSENKKNDVNKECQPANSLRTHTSYLLPDLECALLSFAEDDNIYNDKAVDHTNKANDTHHEEFVNNDELNALTCNLQTHKEFINTNVNNIYERNQQTEPQENKTESIMPCMPTSPVFVPTTSITAAAAITQLSSPEFAKQWSLDNYFDSETTFKQIENDILCDKERQNGDVNMEKEKSEPYTEETAHANMNLLPVDKNSSFDNNNTNSDVCTNNSNNNIHKEKEQAIKLYTSGLQPHPPPSSPPSRLPRTAITHTDKKTLTLKSTSTTESENTKETEQGNRNTNPETNNVVAVAAAKKYVNAIRPKRTSNNMETNPLSSFYQSQQTLQEQTNQREEITTKKEEEHEISVGGNTSNKLTESDEHEETIGETKRINNNNNIFTGGNNNVCKDSANDSLYHSRSKYKIDTSRNTVVETFKTSNDENSSSSIFPPPSALRRTRELPVSKWRKISTAFSIIARQARRTNKDYKSDNNNYNKQEQKQQDDNNINSGNNYFSQTFNLPKNSEKTRMTTQEQKSETLTKRIINKEFENAGKSDNNNDDNDDGNNNKLKNTNNVNKVNYFESTWFRPHREDQEAEEEEEQLQLQTENAQNINKNVDCDNNLQSNVNWSAHSMIRKEKMLPGSESSASHKESVSSENISSEKEDAEEQEVEKEVKAMPNFEHYSNDDSDDACSSDINRFNYSHINRYINTEKLQKSMINYGSHAWLPKESNTANNKYNKNTVFDRITGSAGNKSNVNYALSVVTNDLHYDSFNLPLDFNNEEENSSADMNEEFDGHDNEELEMEENETNVSESDNDNADGYMYSAINHSRLATRGRRNSESSVDSESKESFSNNENEGVNANVNNNDRPDMAITNRPIPWRTPINTNQNTAPNAVNAPWCNNRLNYLRHHNHRLQNVNNLQLKAGVVQAIRPIIPQAPPPPPHTPFPPTSPAKYRQGRYAIPNYAAPNAQVIHQPMRPNNNNIMNTNNHIFMCTETKVNYEAIFNFSLDSVP